MLLVAATVVLGLTASTPPRRVYAVGAVGVVVQHSDGRVLYAYIPLVNDRITGAEALQQAGFPLNLQASSSLGAAVCKIDGEGCDAPKEDCFCKSYGSPAYYWHYYTRSAGGMWRTSSVGAGNRVLHDGDMDGWAWTASDVNLPTLSLAEIGTLVQSPTTAIPATRRPEADTFPPPTTVLPPIPTPLEAPSVTLPRVPSLATPPADTAPATFSSAASPTETPAPPAPPRLTPNDATPRAVIVAPGGTVMPVRATPPPTNRGWSTVGGFVAVSVVALLLLALVPLGARRGGGGNDGTGRKDGRS